MTVQPLNLTEHDKQAIIELIEHWANVRGCGTLKQRMNMVLDSVEDTPEYSQAHFDFAYHEAKKLFTNQHD